MGGENSKKSGDPLFCPGAGTEVVERRRELSKHGRVLALRVVTGWTGRKSLRGNSIFWHRLNRLGFDLERSKFERQKVLH